MVRFSQAYLPRGLVLLNNAEDPYSSEAWVEAEVEARTATIRLMGGQPPQGQD